LNNLAGVYSALGQPARAETLLRRLITLDSLKGAELGRVPDNDANSFIGLAFTQLGLGKVREAELTFQRAVERYGNINSIESSVLLHWSAVGKYTSAESLGTVYLEKYTGVEDLRYAIDQLAQIASARGRLALSERRFREAMELSAKQPNATAYLEDAVSLGFLDIWFRRQPRRGLETVEAALRRYPLASLKPMDRPYLPLAVAYAVAGKPQKARELLAEYEREVPHMYRRTAETFRLWAWGQVAMAEGRIADAVSELQTFASATASDHADWPRWRRHTTEPARWTRQSQPTSDTFGRPTSCAWRGSCDSATTARSSRRPTCGSESCTSNARTGTEPGITTLASSSSGGSATRSSGPR
jgi:tetratricopeptide (TPR) repeat protein